MVELPRIALGNVQYGASFHQLLHCLLSDYAEAAVDVQVFAAQGRLDTGVQQALLSGSRLRHLDNWLMGAEGNQEALLRGGQSRDLSLIVGDFLSSSDSSVPLGGNLDQLCQQLQIPAIAHLDVWQFDACAPPRLPPSCCGLLLSGCRDAEELARWQTRLEVIWGLPVFGGIWEDTVECLTRVVAADSAARTIEPAVGGYIQLHRLLSLARSAPACALPTSPLPSAKAVQIAVAYDDAFHCYFPDAMEQMESAGARLIDFSPLRSERVPAGTDVVYLGCGHPERYAERLAGNICIQQSLRSFVQAGGRLYAEGGGLAYACELMEFRGHCYRMAGLLPAVARFEAVTPRPVELSPDNSAWLKCDRLRGYLNPNWLLVPRPGLQDYSTRSDCPLSLIGDRQAIGSRIHLHFASQPKLLQSLLSPVVSTRSNDA
ncbi:MAG: hypothetical protein KDA92_13195 [Planctomycetales bacterium]|nr:hypothetical protein [Planctomycetales bacterium]MCA9167324.1 hypothetical protein [Planctomycetales bacterium]